VAGNAGGQASFGAAGTVIIDGTDANEHGSFDAANQVNLEGWLYIEKALDNIGPNVTNGNRVIVALGATPSTVAFGGAGAAIYYAFQAVEPAGPGLEPGLHRQRPVRHDDRRPEQQRPERHRRVPPRPARHAQGYGSATGTAVVQVPNVRLSDTGILYVTTANNASGDIDNAELAIINNHGLDIASFVNGGGGLFSHAESAGSTFVPIAAAPNGATEVGNTVTITTASAHGLRAGQVVTITGFGSGGIAAGYRGTFTVASVPSPTTFTYTNPTSGLPPSGGGFVLVPGQAAYGWLTSIFPGIGVVQESAFSLTGVTVTPQGRRLPRLTSADLSTGPWHNYFVVPPTITVLTPLATAVNNAGQTVPLILTSIGAPSRP
jgi:hypothetical protein